MVKSLEVDATYEIAKRSHKWLKVRKPLLVEWGPYVPLRWRSSQWHTAQEVLSVTQKEEGSSRAHSGQP